MQWKKSYCKSVKSCPFVYGEYAMDIGQDLQYLKGNIIYFMLNENFVSSQV